MKSGCSNLLLAALLTLGLNQAGICADTTTPDVPKAPGAAKASHQEEPWWQHSVFYEIYPRSFADSDNSGTGDLKGITSKLDYLKNLGVGAIWLTPCYPSPQVDFGYDVSDYEKIDPTYGTMADFDQLVAEAKKRNIRIVMDLVMNHSSDRNAWFEESASSRTNPKRDWYIWRDGAAPNKPPNNWQSIFGGSAWTFDPKTKQYYYHFFYKEQPDLNWRNLEVRKRMYDVARFWLDRGVAGFRLDAVGTLFEFKDLPDNPVLSGKNKVGNLNMENKYNENMPEVHEVMHELRKVLDTYPDDRVLIGETYGLDVPAISKFYGKDLDEVQLPMNFFFCEIGKLSAAEFRKQVGEWDNNPAKGWPVYVLSNHDRVRHYDRFGNGSQNDEIAKLTATILLTLRGTPIMYYGEEIGMQNRTPERKEDVQDPVGRVGWPEEKGRDGERTPMHWSAATNAGFTTGKPWLPMAANYTTHNVAAESDDPNSILNFYKRLIHLRDTESALTHGSYIPLNESDQNVFSYLRKGPNSSVIIAVNMSAEARTITLDGFTDRKATMLLASPAREAGSIDLKRLSLKPYGVVVARIE